MALGCIIRENVQLLSVNPPSMPSTRDRVDPLEINTAPLRRPEWIRVRAPSGETTQWVQGLMRSKTLHTVCEEAMCPNLGECWCRHSDILDVGRCLHSLMRLLRHQTRPASPRGLAGTGTSRPGGECDEPQTCSHHQRQS